MAGAIDWSLYLCTDRILSKGRSIVEAVEAAIEGGVTVVQVREKEASTREFYRVALEIKAVADRHGVPVIVNDRADIALAIGAQGLHLGQSDLPIKEARRIVGGQMVIGVSASTPQLALEAQQAGADYLGVGAVFPTGSKADAKHIGLEAFRAVQAAVTIPIVAIGGIGAGNAAEVMAAGADGIAVISAILSQPDIRAAAENLKGIVK